MPLIGAGVGVLNCRSCKGYCNKTGYPSAMKESTYCQKMRKVASNKTLGMWNKIHASQAFRMLNKAYKKSRGR